jgi:hypothetical protein
MKFPSVLLIPLGFGWAIGCSSGPPRPQPGSAAFLWAEAKQSYRIGDLLKTDSILLELRGTDNAYAADARVWQLIVSAGLTQGFLELADAYESGSRHDTANPLRFRNQADKLRSFAATAALEFAQAVHDLAGNDNGESIRLAFEFPAGSAVPPEEVLKISYGVWLRDSDREPVETAMLRRGVLRAVFTAVGHPEDPAAALAVFQSTAGCIPRAVFISGMAGLLYEQSDLFGARRMNRPDRFILMCRTARESLQSIPQSEETGELALQIESALKKSGGI